jgi:hypothetical protein
MLLPLDNATQVKTNYGYQFNIDNNRYFYQLVNCTNKTIDIQVQDTFKGVRKNYTSLNDVTKHELDRLLNAFNQCDFNEWLKLID